MMLELEDPGSEFCLHTCFILVARRAVKILSLHVLNTGQRAGLCAGSDIE